MATLVHTSTEQLDHVLLHRMSSGSDVRFPKSDVGSVLANLGFGDLVLSLSDTIVK